MNILTTYIAPVFIGLTAFLTSIAMGGVTGASMTFAFGSGLVSGLLIAIGGVVWMVRFRNKYTKQ